MSAKMGSAAKRRKIAAIILRDGISCFWCKEETLLDARRMGGQHEPRCTTIDHLIPRSRGGGNELENLVIACRECNEARGNITYIPHAYRQEERAA